MERDEVSAVRPAPRRSPLTGVLAVFFAVAGLLHLVRPSLYLPIMPPYLPQPLALVYISGLGEIAGGLGLLVPRVHRAAGYGLVALLAAVFPANVQMLLNNLVGGTSPVLIVALILRLPLQPLLMALVLRSAGVTRTRSGKGLLP